MGMASGTGGGRYRPIRVLILDDHPVVAAGLENFINLSGDIVVVDTLQNDVQLIEAVEQDPPDLVILDLELPGSRRDGIEVAQYLRQHYCDIKLLALSAFMDVSRVVRAIQVDIDGYLSKTTDCISIVDAIRQIVYTNRKLFDPAVTSIMKEYLQGHHRHRSGARFHAQGHRPLTEREWEVMEYIVRGNTYQEIATLLFISLATVKTHAQSICNKLGVQDRIQVRTWYFFTSEEEKQSWKPPGLQK